MTPRRLRVACFALLVSSLASPARASEPELFGPGVRSAALGGTGASYADDYEACYANPAGLAFARTRRLGVAFVAGRFDLQLDGARHPVDDANGLYIGAQLPVPFGGLLADRVVLGLLVYMPIGVVNRAANPFPTTPVLSVLDNRTQTVSIMLTTGIRLHRRFSIGAGALALAALTGEIDLGTDGAGHFTTRSNEQLVASYAPIVGARFEAGHGVRLGLVFRGESLSRYDIAVPSDLQSLLKIFTLPTLRFAGISQYDPMQLALEASWQPVDAILVAAGIGWHRWSAFPAPAEWVTPPPEGTPMPPSPDFHDTVVPRVAFEWHVRNGAVSTVGRAGYFFAQSPAPMDATHVQLDANRHVFTMGLDVTVENRHAPLHVAGFWQWHQLEKTPRAAGQIAVAGVTLGVDL